MKRPFADYSGFSLSKINQPEYSHLKLLLGWPVFFLLFILTEQFIPAAQCRPIHCALDDAIPFCEFFVIPYVLWYGLIAFSLGYFLFYDVDSFKKLQKYIFFLQLSAILIYIVFPSRQDLRPAFFPRENLLTDIVGFIYSIDTNTGVCPSLHCAISIAIASVWAKYKNVPKAVKISIALFCLTICLSTVFIKQHSFIDFLAALPLCLIGEYLLFRKT
jgi:membrane-associated phospholipid phosphatase